MADLSSHSVADRSFPHGVSDLWDPLAFEAARIHHEVAHHHGAGRHHETIQTEPLGHSGVIINIKCFASNK